jgi:hypothetical protein
VETFRRKTQENFKSFVELIDFLAILEKFFHKRTPVSEISRKLTKVEDEGLPTFWGKRGNVVGFRDFRVQTFHGKIPRKTGEIEFSD